MLLPIWWMRKLRSGKAGNSACTSKLFTYKFMVSTLPWNQFTDSH